MIEHARVKIDRTLARSSRGHISIRVGRTRARARRMHARYLIALRCLSRPRAITHPELYDVRYEAPSVTRAVLGDAYTIKKPMVYARYLLQRKKKYLCASPREDRSAVLFLKTPTFLICVNIISTILSA